MGFKNLSNMPFEKLNTFDLFLPTLKDLDFSQNQILDYGGHSGNFLESSRGKIKQEHYTCLDVDINALKSGAQNFPNAKWAFYDKFNPCYNPSGEKKQKFVFKNKFDLIVSYSVFTHFSENEMLSTLLQLYLDNLNKRGRICFSFLEPSAVDWFLNKRLKNGAKFNKISKLEWTSGRKKFLMIDDAFFYTDTSFYPNECTHYLSFYDKEYLLDLLDSLKPSYYPPHLDSPQSYMKLVKE